MSRSALAAALLLLQLAAPASALAKVHDSRSSSDSLDHTKGSLLTADGLELINKRSEAKKSAKNHHHRHRLTADGLIIAGTDAKDDAEPKEVVAAAGTDADASSDSSIDESPRSKEEIAAMRAEAFEKEFTVELNMTHARKVSMPLGVKVDIKSEFQPLSIRMINDGLVQAWNKANPEKEILVGDQVTKVNQHVWHHNTRLFGERMKSMFQAAKNNAPGAEPILTLSIQRPRRQEAALPAQLLDLHKSLYGKEFDVSMEVPRTKVEKTMADTLGWKLNVSSNYWMPVAIGSIKQTGLVSKWNEDNPENTILPGDEIMKVNDVAWKYNSYAFIEKIVKDFEASRANDAKEPVPLKVSVRRLRTAEEQSEFELKHKVHLTKVSQTNVKHKEATTTSKAVSFMAALPVPKATKAPQSKVFGWQLSYEDESSPPVIGKIRSNGLVAKWNQAHPEQAVRPGDQIVEVNNFQWKKGNSREFAIRLGKEFEASSKRTSGANPRMYLRIERRATEETEEESDEAGASEDTSEKKASEDSEEKTTEKTASEEKTSEEESSEKKASAKKVVEIQDDTSASEDSSEDKEKTSEEDASASEDKDSEEKASEKKDSEEKDSEEKDSEDKDSEEKDSEEKDSEEKTSEKKASEEKVITDDTSEEKDSEKKDSEEKDSQEKDSEEKASEEKSSNDDAAVEEETKPSENHTEKAASEDAEQMQLVEKKNNASKANVTHNASEKDEHAANHSTATVSKHLPSKRDVIAAWNELHPENKLDADGKTLGAILATDENAEAQNATEERATENATGQEAAGQNASAAKTHQVEEEMAIDEKQAAGQNASAAKTHQVEEEMAIDEKQAAEEKEKLLAEEKAIEKDKAVEDSAIEAKLAEEMNAEEKKATEKPASEEKATKAEKATEETATEENATKENATEETATEETATEETATEETATEETATEETATEETATEESATEEKATEETATEETATEEKATEKKEKKEEATERKAAVEEKATEEKATEKREEKKEEATEEKATEKKATEKKEEKKEEATEEKATEKKAAIEEKAAAGSLALVKAAANATGAKAQLVDYRLWTGSTEERDEGAINCWDIGEIKFFSDEGCSTKLEVRRTNFSGFHAQLPGSLAFDGNVSTHMGGRSVDGDYGSSEVWVSASVPKEALCMKVYQPKHCLPGSKVKVQQLLGQEWADLKSVNWTNSKGWVNITLPKAKAPAPAVWLYADAEASQMSSISMEMESAQPQAQLSQELAQAQAEAQARDKARVRAEAKARVLEAQMDALEKRWAQRLFDAREQSMEEQKQLETQYKMEVEDLKATHESDLNHLNDVKELLSEGLKAEERDIRMDERSKAKAELEAVREHHRQELEDLQRGHQDQDRLARLMEEVQSSVRDAERASKESQASHHGDQEQKLAEREASLLEVEQRLMSESKDAEEQQNKVSKLVDSVTRRLEAGEADRGLELTAREDEVAAREKSVREAERRLVSALTMQHGSLSELVANMSRRMEAGETDRGLELSAREEQIEAREKSVREVERRLSAHTGNLSQLVETMDTQQHNFMSLVSKLEEKSDWASSKEKNLRGAALLEQAAAQEKSTEHSFDTKLPMPQAIGLMKAWNKLHPEEQLSQSDKITSATLKMSLGNTEGAAAPTAAEKDQLTATLKLRFQRSTVSEAASTEQAASDTPGDESETAASE